MELTVEPILRLQASFRHYPVPEGGHEVSSAILRRRLRLSGLPEECLLAALDQLEKGLPAHSAAQQLAMASGLSVDNANRLLNHLETTGVLLRTKEANTACSQEEGRYDRQIRFFNAFEREDCPGRELNDRLQHRRVVIVGLGGYGTWLALLCARLGIRQIVGIDPDHVEATNLNRQVLYRESDIGRPKAEACAEALSTTDPEVCFEGHRTTIRQPEDLLPYLEDADLVFNSFAYLPLKQARHNVLGHIAQACVRAGVPSLTFCGSWLGPLNVPGVTACYWCLGGPESPLKAAMSSGYGGILAASLPDPEARFQPAFAPRIALSASLAVWEASRFLSDALPTSTREGVLTLDLFHYRPEGTQTLKVPRDPHCPLCGDAVLSGQSASL